MKLCFIMIFFGFLCVCKGAGTHPRNDACKEVLITFASFERDLRRVLENNKGELQLLKERTLRGQDSCTPEQFDMRFHRLFLTFKEHSHRLEVNRFAFWEDIIDHIIPGMITWAFSYQDLGRVVSVFSHAASDDDLLYFVTRMAYIDIIYRKRLAEAPKVTRSLRIHARNLALSFVAEFDARSESFHHITYSPVTDSVSSSVSTFNNLRSLRKIFKIDNFSSVPVGKYELLFNNGRLFSIFDFDPMDMIGCTIHI